MSGQVPDTCCPWDRDNPHTDRWFGPDSVAPKDGRDTFDARPWYSLKQSRTLQYPDDLSIEACGQCEHIDLFRTESGVLRQTVRIESRTHDRRGIEDGQSIVRRSALYAACSPSISASVRPAALA